MLTECCFTASLCILTILFLLALTKPSVAANGFHIKNGKLYDANDNVFVPRGINHPHCWYPNRLSSLADIKTVGKANTARVVLCSGNYGGGAWGQTTETEIQNIINTCKSNKLHP